MQMLKFTYLTLTTLRKTFFTFTLNNHSRATTLLWWSGLRIPVIQGAQWFGTLCPW